MEERIGVLQWFFHVERMGNDRIAKNVHGRLVAVEVD